MLGAVGYVGAHRRDRFIIRRRLVGLATAIGVTVLMSTLLGIPIAVGAHEPIIVPGNSTCEVGEFSFKDDDGPLGAATNGDVTITYSDSTHTTVTASSRLHHRSGHREGRFECSHLFHTAIHRSRLDHQQWRPVGGDISRRGLLLDCLDHYDYRRIHHHNRPIHHHNRYRADHHNRPTHHHNRYRADHHNRPTHHHNRYRADHNDNCTHDHDHRSTNDDDGLDVGGSTSTTQPTSTTTATTQPDPTTTTDDGGSNNGSAPPVSVLPTEIDQTELPQTGLGDAATGALGAALVIAGAGVLLVAEQRARARRTALLRRL